MSRVVLGLTAVLVLCLVGASSASARIAAYQEGKTNVDTTAALVWSVKPVGGQNNWWWYLDNTLVVNTAVCYRYSLSGGAYKSPNGSNWAAPSTDTFGTMPVAGTSVCEGPYASGTKGYIGPKSITGLSSGTVAKYCAQEWYRSGSIGWQLSADPERCQTIKADTGAPTLGVDLKQGGNPVSLTNSPASVQVTINYSDSVSPPWNRGTPYGDNRLCTSTSAACTSPPNTFFNFSAACSNGIQSLSQAFTCPMGTPGADGNFFQCFAGFDGAVTDAVPSNLLDNNDIPPNFANDDPVNFTQTFPDGTGNFGIGCDSVLVDRAAPDTTITSGPAESSTIATTAPVFSFTSTEGGSTFQCKVDGGVFAACSSPNTTSGLGNGSHTFSVRSTDPAGNTDALPATRAFTVAVTDTTPPDTAIDSGPSGTVTTDQATFTFSGNPTLDTAKVQCSIDDEPFADCTSPKTFTGLPDGAHTAAFRAEDATGNRDQSPATRNFTVVTTGAEAIISKVKVKGSAKVKKGKKATYKVTISNSGNIEATGVKLKVKGKGVTATESVGGIAAGKSRKVKISIKPKKAGKVKLTFKVTSANAGGKSARKTITVKK